MHRVDDLVSDEHVQLLREYHILDSVLQATDVMLVLLDPAFNFVWVNNAYAATCHMTPEEMIGKNHFALYPHPENELIFRRARDRGEKIFYKDKPFVFPDQPERGVTYWDWSLTPIKDSQGKVRNLVLSLRETTRFKLAEEALRASETRYKALFETMAEGFSIKEIVRDDAGVPCDFRYIEVNPAFEWHTGLKAADILGRTIRELFPDTEPTWIERYGRVALTGEPIHFQAQFGPLSRWFEVSAYQTEPGRFATVLFDISEVKRAEEALREGDRRKDVFLVTLAHELRNPLAAIRTAVDVTSRACNDPARVTKMTEILDRQTSQLAHLVDDLLDINRIVRGKIDLQMQDFDLAALVGQVVEGLRSVCEGKGQRLEVSLPNAPVRVPLRQNSCHCFRTQRIGRGRKVR